MAPDSSPPPPSEGHWLEALDRVLLRGLVSRRSLENALASTLGYVRPPTLPGGREGSVHAVLGEPGESERPGGGAGIRVELRILEGGNTLVGECSRCAQTFGPCTHVTVLALDLASSADIRRALLAGERTTNDAARAPAIRFAAAADARFDGALGAWLAPTAEGTRVEISATPFGDADPHVGRAYGDRMDPADLRILTVAVRPAGERKLLAPREIAPQSRDRIPLSARDRRVLQHTRDRGVGRKAVQALGVEASLTIEAMRVHRGVFRDGFKGLLDFRTSFVRPTITYVVGGAPGSGGALDALSAFWTVDAHPASIAFSDAVFFPGPFPFVWTKAGAIFRVARDVDLDLAEELARAATLVVPKGKLREAGARLFRATRGRGVALPTHETFGLPPTETPTIVLRLAGEPLDLTGELVATYRAREVSLFPVDGVGSEDGRDLELERRARERVRAAGVVRYGLESENEHDRSEANAETEGRDDEARVGARDEGAIAFWREGLLGLRAATDPPIDVQLSDRLARVRVGAPLVGRVHVTLEGNWLDTRLEFSSDRMPVEMATIRAALARKKRWIALSDGTLSRISSSLESLANEADALMKGDAARLPAHQLGRLDRWIDENDGRVDVAVRALRARLRALAVSAEPEMPEGLEGTLRPYQRLGLAWLQFLQALGAGGILADDMGLGKTITTLAFLLRRKEAEGPAPSLVVCPTSVATNWVREAARFTPGLRVLLLHGAGRQRAYPKVGESDLVVTTYAILRRDEEALTAIKFRCAVLDEAQNIKNADGATTHAAGRLNASMRLALSGTPIENRLRELWSLASFANPGILGSSRAFETRFERPIASDRGSPLAAELRAVVRPFLLRRTKNEVLRELPPKTEIDHVVELRRDDKRLYDALAHALRASVAKDIEKRGGLSSLSVFTALTRLRQMACDPRLVDPGLAHHETESAKREAFLEIVRELVAEGRRALVFSQFVQLLTLWRKDLDREKIAYEYLDGSTTKRDQVVARFQEGSAPLFLISLKAGGAGLNLTAADTVIHCDPWWNPAVEDQATDRAYRIGQEKPVTVIRLIARGTIEEKILSLKAKKRDLTKAVIGDDARALEGLTEEDIRNLLGDAETRGEEADEGDAADDDSDEDSPSLTDVLATATQALDPDFDVLVTEVKWWMASTGRRVSDLAPLVEIPLPFALSLANGEPFPCSRAVAERIRARLKTWC
jgi:superfamily II DNA or RNA helicase